MIARLVHALRCAAVYALIGCLSLNMVGNSLMPAVGLPQAVAAKHKKKKGSAAEESGPARTIRQEGKLEPKKDYTLDNSIQKTKDLRPVEDMGKRPALSAEQLDQTRVEAMMDEKLDEEIQSESQLVELSTTCEDSSSVRYNLADAYWEKSKREFFKANDNNLSEGERARHGQIMKDLQGRTLELYQKITDECPNYQDIAKVLFYYGRALMELERAKEGAALFKQIIKDHPDTEWVPQAWFMVGEYYFNTANDANAALKAYVKATETPHTQIYGFALYKQGWCYINVAEWNLAIQRFEQAVRVSEDPKQPLDDRTRAALRKEALKDYVRAYSNLADARGALAKFRQVANAKEIPTMLENLGNWYINQGSHANVVITYHDLIKTYPQSTRLPVFQGRVVDAMSRLGSPAATVKEVKLLTDYFLKLRDRIAKKELSPDQQTNINKDIGEAEEIAENTIRRLATDYHKEAKKLRGVGQQREYEFALELYKHYLEVFPEPKPNAEVNYVFFMRFYYAEILYKMEHFLEAARNYDMVVEMNPRPTDPKQKEIVLAAAEESVRSYDELVTDLDRKTPPVINGMQPKPIPEVKLQLINACKRYIDYVGSEGDKIVEIRFKMARIYYTYNHFDQAAPAFNDIVQNHPATQVACYAANLALDIYNGEKNFKALKEASHAYRENKQLACGDDDRKRFAAIEEKSTFSLIKSEYEDKKKYIPAGNAYMQFYKDYPTSEYADDSVYNAALNYDLGNRLDKANEVRRFLVEKLPNSELVPETLYSIAQSYERVVDFENASKYLEMFAKRYPKDKRSKDAIYNSALYRATLHDFDGAREERQNFIKLYPDDPEVYQVAFSICEATEEQARLLEAQHHKDQAMKYWQDAHDCYFSYVKNGKYTSANPDLLCHAQFRRGEIMRTKTHYDKGFEEQKRLILKMWPTWKRAGMAKVPRCAEAVAEINFRELVPAFKHYNDMSISSLDPTPKGKKNFDASLKGKVVERDKMVEAYKGVVELGVAQWALAALFNIGEAYRDSIDKLLGAPVPDKIPGYKLTADDKKLLRQQLREMAAPIEEKAVEAYKICVGKANELGVYNKWSVRSLDQLQKLRPQEYPLVVEELVPVRLEEPLRVQRNGLIVLDGEELKPVRVKFKEETKKEEPAPTPAAAPQPAAAPAPAPGAPAKPAAKPAGGEDVPAPVEE